MSNIGMFGFWMFIAAIVVAGIWYDAKQKETKQETLRRIVESGRDIDPEVLGRNVACADQPCLFGERCRNTARDLRIGAYITLGVAPGLFLFSLFLGMINEEARFAIMGVSALVACIGGGLLGAARLVERRYAD